MKNLKQNSSYYIFISFLALILFAFFAILYRFQSWIIAVFIWGIIFLVILSSRDPFYHKIRDFLPALVTAIGIPLIAAIFSDSLLKSMHYFSISQHHSMPDFRLSDSFAKISIVLLYIAERVSLLLFAKKWLVLFALILALTWLFMGRYFRTKFYAVLPNSIFEKTSCIRLQIYKLTSYTRLVLSRLLLTLVLHLLAFRLLKIQNAFALSFSLTLFHFIPRLGFWLGALLGMIYISTTFLFVYEMIGFIILMAVIWLLNYILPPEKIHVDKSDIIFISICTVLSGAVVGIGSILPASYIAFVSLFLICRNKA